MPRGRAEDTLPEEIAEKVRRAVAAARNSRGLTNADLARRSGKDYRQVTNALQASLPLRAGVAQALLKAARSHRRGDQSIDLLVSGELAASSAAISAWEFEKAHRLPIAIIARHDVRLFARRLADGIAQCDGFRNGFSNRRRHDLELAITKVVAQQGPLFAREARRDLTNSFSTPQPALDEQAARHVLARFGYEFEDIHKHGGGSRQRRT